MVFAFLKIDNSALFTSLRRHGFKATSDKNQQKLADAIELLDTHQLTHFKVRQKIKQLREHATKHQSLDSVKPLLRLNLFVLPIYLRWQKQQVALFDDPKWWKGRLEAAKTLENSARDKALQTIPLLHQLWKQQNHYALYSTWDLIYVYEQVFPLFREWLLYARMELRNKRRYLPEKILRNYQQYLNNVAKSLAYEQQQIRMAFKSRLVAGLTKQNAQFDEVISLIQDDLQALGIFSDPERSPHPETSGYITPDVFVKMQHIIEEDATENEKTDWYSLAYNAHRDPDHHSSFSTYYRYTQQGHTYRIPAKLAVHIPIKLPFYLKLPSFLHWFFFTDQFIYTFFQQATCQYLLAIEQSFTAWVCPVEVNLLTLETNLSWQGLQHLWEHLAAEKVRAQNIQKNLSIFTRGKLTPLLEGYQAHLHQWVDEVFSKQILMMSRALQPFKQKAMTEEEKQELEQKLKQLQQTQADWKPTSELSEQLSMLVLQSHHLLNRPVVTTEILKSATEAIDRLSHGEQVTPEALNAITTAQNSIALGHVSEANDYVQTRFSIETYLAKEKIPDLLNKELLENPLYHDQETLTLHVQKLITYHTWVLREKPPLMDPVILNDQLCYYAYRFLQSIHDLSSKEAFLAKNSRDSSGCSYTATLNRNYVPTAP